jgi:hypothetical protein
MPYLPNEENSILAALSVGEGGKIDLCTAELFASPPPTLDALFADPMVSRRIGMLIAQAATRPTQPRRRYKAR